MEINLGTLVQKLLSSAEQYTLVQSGPNGDPIPTPNFDLTASRILRSIAFSISEAMDDSQTKEIERLRQEIRKLTYCDCGRPLSPGLCGTCDNDG